MYRKTKIKIENKIDKIKEKIFSYFSIKILVIKKTVLLKRIIVENILVIKFNLYIFCLNYIERYLYNKRNFFSKRII